MSLTISVPAQYGYTVLSTCVFSLFIVPVYMGGPVMNARKEFNVQYPNLYATPGVHKQADEFNRVQRGHQVCYWVMDRHLVLTTVSSNLLFVLLTVNRTCLKA